MDELGFVTSPLPDGEAGPVGAAWADVIASTSHQDQVPASLRRRDAIPPDIWEKFKNRKLDHQDKWSKAIDLLPAAIKIAAQGPEVKLGIQFRRVSGVSTRPPRVEVSGYRSYGRHSTIGKVLLALGIPPHIVVGLLCSP